MFEGRYSKKSSKCKNCGEWSFDEHRKEPFVLENKLKEISKLLNKKDDEVDLNKIREIVEKENGNIKP